MRRREFKGQYNTRWKRRLVKNAIYYNDGTCEVFGIISPDLVAYVLDNATHWNFHTFKVVEKKNGFKYKSH